MSTNGVPGSGVDVSAQESNLCRTLRDQFNKHLLELAKAHALPVSTDSVQLLQLLVDRNIIRGDQQVTCPSTRTPSHVRPIERSGWTETYLRCPTHPH
jgi:hypothetical protein